MTAVHTFDIYQKGLEEDKLIGISCNDCSTVTAMPQAVCRQCGGRNLVPKELKKSGTIQTYTVIRVAPEGVNPPYIVAMVETDDGPWVIGNVIDVDPEQASMDLIGKKVTIGNKVVKGDVYSMGEMRALTFAAA